MLATRHRRRRRFAPRGLPLPNPFAVGLASKAFITTSAFTKEARRARRWRAAHGVHGVLPALGLDVDLLQPEAVERDDAVDAAVTRATNALKVGAVGAVAHGVEQIEHELLGERLVLGRERLPLWG